MYSYLDLSGKWIQRSLWISTRETGLQWTFAGKVHILKIIRVDAVLQGSLSNIGYLYKSTKYALDSCDQSCEWFDVIVETPFSVVVWAATTDAGSGIWLFQHKTLGNWCKWSPNGQSLRFWFRRNPQLLILTSPLSAFQFNSFEISDSEAAEICSMCAIADTFLQSVCNESN